MRFSVTNLKDSSHTICRTNGSKITIQPKSFVILDTDNESEINYWRNVDKNILKKCGLDVITSDKDIDSLQYENSNVVKDVSVIDGFASPMAEQTFSESQENSPDSKNYSEENLLKLPKEDLFNICDNFNIKYKRSNSVKTLVNLILGSGKV